MTWRTGTALALALLAGLVPASAAGATVDEGAVARGGRLYDHWSRELRERPPAGIHPAMAARLGSVAAADSWRCSECHGWDYKGRHGMPGIRGRQGADPAAIVPVLKDATHRYGDLLRDGELLDLAQFVSHGQVDMTAAADPKGLARADMNAIARQYGSICSGCHGLDGDRLREIPPLGDAARQRPHEVLHVVLNGHAGGNMPGLRALGTDLAAGFLGYLQGLPTLNVAAAIAHGGRLYDDWQVEAVTRRPLLPHPAYPATARHANDAALTWRCKACHGWDYQGHRGQYASGPHATGIKGISGMVGADPARIVSILKDGRHLYGAILKERDLQDLAHFVSAGQVDMDAAIDRRSRAAQGDPGRARAAYDTVCAVCHGKDGRRIVTAPPLGQLARANPWESLHKIFNGHPDEKMPALRELGRQLLVDILAYVQTLPETR